MNLQGVLLDQLGHFGPPQLLSLLLSMVSAAGLAGLLAFAGAGLRGRALRELVVWAALAALGVGLVRAQLPLALSLLALAVLVGRPERGQGQLLFAMALVVGLGCGSGASLITAVAAAPLALLLRWAHRGADRT